MVVMISKRKLMGFVLPLAAAGAVLVPATAAEAATGDYAANGVYIRTGPHLNSTAVGEGYPGQGAIVYCYTHGDSVGGNTLWLFNQDRATGKTGYSSAVYLNWSGTIHDCSNV